MTFASGTPTKKITKCILRSILLREAMVKMYAQPMLLR
jgi:hypothetical protein